MEMRAEGPSPLPTPGSNLLTLAYRCRNDGLQTAEFIGDGVQGLTGYSAEDFTSGRLHWTEIVHPDDVGRNRQILEDALREGRPFGLEYRIRHRDGSERWVWDQGHGVVRDEHGSVALAGCRT